MLFYEGSFFYYNLKTKLNINNFLQNKVFHLICDICIVTDCASLAVNSKIFKIILFFIYSVKTYLHIKSLQLGYVLLTSINDKVISPFREGFIFQKHRIRENKNP